MPSLLGRTCISNGKCFWKLRAALISSSLTGSIFTDITGSVYTLKDANSPAYQVVRDYQSGNANEHRFTTGGSSLNAGAIQNIIATEGGGRTIIVG